MLVSRFSILELVMVICYSLETRLLFCCLLVILHQVAVDAYACFECISVNGDNPDCDDTFGDLVAKQHLLRDDCRVGPLRLYPLGGCYKLKGIRDNGENFTIRGCSEEPLLHEVTHYCGRIEFQLSANTDKMSEPASAEMVTGCLSTCHRNDGCNGAETGLRPPGLLLLILIICLIFLR